jgi:CDP-diacylglycerol--glycerol-3-phosphate 3-phosphatidyltransferase
VNLPNAITLARIALVPVFLVLAYRPGTGAAVGAFAVFLIASLSDSLDGYLARKNNTVSRMGQFLDPLADKLLVGAALVVLVGTRDLPLWIALLIAFREVAIQILRTQIVSGGGDLPASPVAKIKTVAQISMVCWWLLPWSSVNVGHWAWVAVVLGTTLWSGVEYLVKAQSRPEEVAP